MRASGFRSNAHAFEHAGIRTRATSAEALSKLVPAGSPMDGVVSGHYGGGMDVVDDAGDVHALLMGDPGVMVTPLNPASPGLEPCNTHAHDIDRVAEIERLAALDPLDYEVARESAAKELGVRAPALDKLVKDKRRTPRLRPR